MLYININGITSYGVGSQTNYITLAQDRAMKRLAQQQGITEAEILRKALDQYLAQEGIVEIQDPFADLIGMFEGPSKVNHDDIYR